MSKTGLSAALLFCLAALCACGTTNSDDLAALDSAPTEASIARGKELYQGMGCVVCHGAEGHGDGPAVPALTVSPRNFTDASAYKYGNSAREIAETIRGGIGDPKSVMPSYSHLKGPDLMALAHYVKSLQQ